MSQFLHSFLPFIDELSRTVTEDASDPRSTPTLFLTSPTSIISSSDYYIRRLEAIKDGRTSIWWQWSIEYSKRPSSSDCCIPLLETSKTGRASRWRQWSREYGCEWAQRKDCPEKFTFPFVSQGYALSSYITPPPLYISFFCSPSTHTPLQDIDRTKQFVRQGGYLRSHSIHGWA